MSMTKGEGSSLEGHSAQTTTTKKSRVVGSGGAAKGKAALGAGAGADKLVSGGVVEKERKKGGDKVSSKEGKDANGKRLKTQEKSNSTSAGSSEIAVAKKAKDAGQSEC